MDTCVTCGGSGSTAQGDRGAEPSQLRCPALGVQALGIHGHLTLGTPLSRSPVDIDFKLCIGLGSS